MLWTPPTNYYLLGGGAGRPADYYLLGVGGKGGFRSPPSPQPPPAPGAKCQRPHGSRCQGNHRS